MKPSQIPLPLVVPSPSSERPAPLPVRRPRETGEAGDSPGGARYYREIRGDLEQFFRRLEKPFREVE